MGKGDALASGAVSATFHGTTAVTHEEFAERVGGKMKKEKPKVFGECRDCGYKAMDASEFSSHIRVCPVKPVQ